MFDAKNVTDMNTKVKSIFRSLAATALGLLGFSSCEWLGIGVCMYGEPHADFKAIGTVKDNTGKPIEGIQVAVKQHRHYENTPNVIYDQNDWFESDTVFTDSSGSYELTKSVFDAPHHVTVVFEDIDRDANGGEFEKAEATPEVKRTKKGDKSWYGGAFETRADVVLKKK